MLEPELALSAVTSSGASVALVLLLDHGTAGVVANTAPVEGLVRLTVTWPES